MVRVKSRYCICTIETFPASEVTNQQLSVALKLLISRSFGPLAVLPIQIGSLPVASDSSLPSGTQECYVKCDRDNYTQLRAALTMLSAVGKGKTKVKVNVRVTKVVSTERTLLASRKGAGGKKTKVT